MKNKILFCISYAIIGIALSISIYISYLLFYPFEPARFNNVPFPLEKNVIKQGEKVKYSVEYQKLMNVPTRATHMLINHVQINFPEVVSFLPIGNYALINQDITIPDYIEPGEYYLSICFVYRVNSLREITISARTEKFQVIAK